MADTDGGRKRACTPVEDADHSNNEIDRRKALENDDFDLHIDVSDAEAAVMLLRNKLYPDPAAAAAAAAAAQRSRHAKRSKVASGSSSAVAAAVTAAAAAAAASRSLPPMVFKTQLYTVLTDRTAADRDLEELRQKGRIRIFKVAIGADEYVLLLTSDYLKLIDTLIYNHQQLAAQQEQQQRNSQESMLQPRSNSSSLGSESILAGTPSNSADIAKTLRLFRAQVVPAWKDLSIPRRTLLQLLQKSSSDAVGHSACAAETSSKASAAARSGGTIAQRRLLNPPAGPSRSAGSRATVTPPAYEQHLMAVELMTRDTRNPDCYLLTVPGAAAFVKSVLAGRQEVLGLLKRRKFNETLEKDLACIKVRGSCLTPTFIIKDLQGRGLLTVTDTTAGPLIRLSAQK